MGTKVTVSLDDAEFDALREEAERLNVAPARLATRWIEERVRALGNDAARPSAALLDWLGPRLDALRAEGGWEPDIGFRVFDWIRDEAMDLYEAAAKEISSATLNREIGRFIRERLAADVIMHDGKPKTRRVRASDQRLVTGVTLLQPRD